MIDNLDMVASYWTLAVGADPRSATQFSSVDFRVRVETAARAGFRGIGIWHSDLEHVLEKYSFSELKQILDDNGICHLELEFLTDWFLDGEAKRRSDVRKRLLFTAASELNARCIKVGDLTGQKCPLNKLIERFATLCREASEHGTRIGFEMMPFCEINTLESARALVEGTAAVNGGIFFDLWHIVKLDIPYDAVARFPAQYVSGVEINDGLARRHSLPDLIVETTQFRQFCGEGEFDVKGFVGQILTAGWRVPWGVEVFNKAARQSSIDWLAVHAFDSTVAQFPLRAPASSSAARAEG